MARGERLAMTRHLAHRYSPRGVARHSFLGFMSDDPRN